MEKFLKRFFHIVFVFYCFQIERSRIDGLSSKNENIVNLNSKIETIKENSTIFDINPGFPDPPKFLPLMFEKAMVRIQIFTFTYGYNLEICKTLLETR